ncbi:MAG: dihydrolipoamide acetyltransferase family protein [Eubacteriales bacterium]|jgi:pyruvate dehydrogenase E2 component (dihydrolipoamide acetyltransferase)|nr:dihydrolipoamide acetyltransferase family protein [Eubacteriales bacterium]
MATVVIMPRQGQSVESCVITELNIKKGDTVAAGDTLFSYETDKSSFEEKAATDGTILELFADEGDDVPCLDPVLIIGTPGEDISALIAELNRTQAVDVDTAEIEAPKPAAAAPAPVAASGDKFFRISPRAKNLAAKTDADLAKAQGTGPGGRIIERDINTLLDAGYTLPAEKTDDAAETPQPAVAPIPEAAEFEDIKLTNIRKVIAKSMHASLSDMAQLTLNSSFNATQITAYRAAVKEKSEQLGLPNITLNDMILFAAARTAPNHRSVNAHYLDDTIRYFRHCSLGVAVDTERGLIVPTVFNADTLSLAELSSQAKAIIKEAQSGSINPDLLRGATFTVTNLGSLGVESFTPVINPPQTCILGVNNITYRVKEDGSAYPAMGLSLTFDHRAIDGAPAARFLKELCENLENFSLLLAK